MPALPTGGGTAPLLSARTERSLRRESPRATPRGDAVAKPKAKQPAKAKSKPAASAASSDNGGGTTQRTARGGTKKKGQSGASKARGDGKLAALQLPDEDGQSQLSAVAEEDSPDSVFNKLESASSSSSTSSRRRTLEGARRRPRATAAALEDIKESAPHALFPEEQLAGAAQKAVALAAAELAVTTAAAKAETSASAVPQGAAVEASATAAVAGTKSPVPVLTASAVAAVAASAALPSLRAESLSMRMAARRMEKQQQRANRRRPSLDATSAELDAVAARARPADASASAAASSSAAAGIATGEKLPGSSDWQPPPQRVNARLDAELAKMREERSKREQRLFAQLDRLSSSSGAIASTASALVTRDASRPVEEVVDLSSDTRLAAMGTTTLASGQSFRTGELLKMLRSKTSRRWLRQWLEQPGRVEQVRAVIEQSPAPLKAVLIDVLSRILCDDDDEEEEGARITMLGRHALHMKKRGDLARREAGNAGLEAAAQWAVQDRGDSGPLLLSGPSAPLLLELK